MRPSSNAAAASAPAPDGPQRFLLTLSDALRPLADAGEIQYQAARLLGQELGANRVAYVDVDEAGDAVKVLRHHASGVAPLAGAYRLDEYDPALLRELRLGRTVARDDIAREARLSVEQRDAHERLQLGATVHVPLLKDGRLMALLAVHRHEPHRWSPTEIALIEAVADRTWDAVERARAQQAQQEAVQRYERQMRLFESVVSTTPDFVYVFDRDGRFQYANRRLLEVWGMALPDVVGRTCRELGYEQWHHDMHMREIAQVIATRQPIKGEVPFKAPLTGIFGVYEYIFTPVLAPDGEVELIAGTTRDVTERKLTEQEVRRRSEQFQTLIDGAPTGMFLVDADLRIVQVNPAALRALGSSDRPLRGVALRDVLSGVWGPRFAAGIVQVFERTLRTGESYRQPEGREVRVDTGATEYYDWSVQRIGLPGGGLGVLCYFTEISDQVRAREAIERSEARYRTLFETMDEGFALCEVVRDEQGKAVDVRYVEANPAAQRLTGRDVVGRTLLEIDPSFERSWIDIPARVAATGRPERHEHYARALDAWYDFYLFPATEADRQRVALLFQDITERKRAEAALREADRRKDEFLATLAHELRNPLAPVRTAVHILNREGAPAAQLRSARAIIERQVSYMVRLIDDLLEVSRITLGKLELRRERTTLQQVLEVATEIARPLLKQELQVTVPPEPIALEADPTRLAQVFGNLLSNACRYTPAGGHIALDARVEGGELEVTVRDDGIGIAAEHLPRLFQMFSQVESAGSRAQGGLGIGLALAKGLVELHGGSISARSAGLGSGSEFTVRLPLAAAENAAAPAAVVPAHATTLAGRRILVVDDNRDSALTLATLLELEGAQVRTAYDGESAVAVAREAAPEVILLDIGLPGMNGYDACRAIRAQQAAPRPIVLALTGWGQEDDRRKSAEAGFDGHLVKPVDHAQLLRAIDELTRP
jgi:PAS domain S-box-containing protein